MPRDRAKVHRHLQEAALELFEENGYEQTTAAQIAARANVTERTYFRHFPDKRDILFDGEERLRTVLVDAIADAPPGLGLMATVEHAFATVALMFEDEEFFSPARQAFISATPALREREASKHAVLMDAMARALERRGFETKTAMLAARVAGAVFVFALAIWFEDMSTGLGRCLDRAFDGLGELCVA